MLNQCLRSIHVFKFHSLMGMLFLFATLVGCNKPEEANKFDISSMSETSGAITGGNTIIINGSDFSYIYGVKFDELPCTDMVLVSSSKITCTIPAHAAGAAQVTVYGKANRTATATYTYISAAPTISSFLPASGALAGGNTLTIYGTGFLDGAIVTIGGSACASVVVPNSTHLYCLLPAKVEGTYAVVVTNIDGYTVTAATTFAYQVVPNVTSVSPNIGVLAGGGTLTISGSNFLVGATARIGSTPCTSPTVVNANTITCTIPAKLAGSYSVSVMNTNAKTGSLPSAYTYKALPTISISNPSSGILAGGQLITLTGTGFYSGAAVTIGGVACTGVTFVNSTSLTCTVPANAIAGAYTIVVTNPDLQAGSLVNGFTYHGPPTVTSVSPMAGALAGGGTLTLTGTGFFTGATVTVGGIACISATVVSATTATCTLPANVAGTYTAILTNTDTQSGSLAGAYTYQPAPTVTLVAPLAGALAGGTNITITGTNFLPSASVTVGGALCTAIVVGGPTSITCTTPAHIVGAVNIVVTNTDLQSGSLAGGFTYRVAPTVTGVSPSGGNIAGGTAITITGTGFLTGALVDLGGSACGTITVVSLTSITCTTSAHAFGAVTATVTNNDAQAGIFGSGFTYLAAPTVTGVAVSTGALAGGASVTLTGTGFFAGATVDFGGSACTSINVVGSGNLTCTTPAHAAGAVTVTVTNIDTQSGNLPAAFTYQVAPTVTSVSPSIGPIGGATNITITGTGFLAGATVNIGSNACTAIVVVGPTSITCTTPLSVVSGPVSVTVTNTDTQTGTLATGFVYLLQPSITGVSPSSGALAGLTAITITGSSFFSGATVTVGGSACTSPTVLSSTSISCVLPAQAAGAYDVIVTNIDTQSVTSVNAYTYQIPPTVVSVSPASGALAGGTGITVTGTDFVTGATVTVGGVACTSVIVANATTLTCTTPANVAGSYAIAVTNTDTQSGSAAGLYTYQSAPTVTSVTPSAGPLAGATMITIAGTGFLNGATVNVGGTPCTGVAVGSAISITCNTPAKAAGSYAVAVTNVDLQSGSLNSAYTYQAAPAVTSVSPLAGALAGGTTLTITGSAFLAGATVTVGGVACTSPTIVSATSITCTLPAMVAGAYTVAVTNTDTQNGSLATAYTYQIAPTVGVATNNFGPVAGGTFITISGTGFLAGATVNIGGTSCTGVTVVGLTSITCTTQAKVAGAYSITIANTDGQSGSAANAFTYQAAPAVTSVSPNGGALAGGTAVTITGSGFLAGATIDFGGSSCAGLVVVNSTTITCTTSAHVAGAVTVTATNTDAQTGNVASAFTYRAAPTVTSVSANSGLQAGGTSVTITGTGFMSGAVANFGATPCTGLNVVNSTTITCSTPANAAGAVAVAVLNLDGQSGSTPAAFTYTAIPVLEFQLGLISPNPPDPDSYGSTTTNITHTFTVTNTGEGTSTAITISLSGTNPAAYFFGTDNCSGSTLAPATTCTVQLTFLGAFMTTGSYSAVLNATAISGGTDTNVVSGSVP